MKKVRFLVIGIVISFLFLQFALAEEEITKIYNNAKPAVVLIVVKDSAGKEKGQGTGFLIDNLHVITNFHVIDGASSASIKTSDGKWHEAKGIAASDQMADLANLALTTQIDSITPLKLSKKDPQTGQKVVVLGNPLGLESTVSDGIISSIRELPGSGKVLQITAPISPGSSGSPVLNMDGEVIGVAKATIIDGQNLNFAILSQDVVNLNKNKASSTAPFESKSISADYKTKAIDFCLTGKYEEALPLFQKWTKEEPNYSIIHFELGFIYGETGQSNSAIEEFKIAIRLKPDDADAHCNLGVAYGKTDQSNSEIEEYKIAIRLKPDFANAHYKLGLSYFVTGQYNSAIEEFKIAIRLKPDFAEAHIGLGLAYGETGQPNSAIEEYKIAIRLKPDYAVAHYNFGLLYYKTGQYNSAIEEYKIAIQLKPDYADAHNNLGTIYGQTGQYNSAFEEFKIAIRLKPDDANAHLGLGITYLIVKDKNSALDEYKILQKLDPEAAKTLFNVIYPPN